MHEPNKAFQMFGEGICPGGIYPGVCVLGSMCPWGYMSGSKCPGVSVRFFFVLSPIWLYTFQKYIPGISFTTTHQRFYQIAQQDRCIYTI